MKKLRCTSLLALGVALAAGGIAQGCAPKAHSESSDSHKPNRLGDGCSTNGWWSLANDGASDDLPTSMTQNTGYVHFNCRFLPKNGIFVQNSPQNGKNSMKKTWNEHEMSVKFCEKNMKWAWNECEILWKKHEMSMKKTWNEHEINVKFCEKNMKEHQFANMKKVWKNALTSVFTTNSFLNKFLT